MSLRPRVSGTGDPRSATVNRSVFGAEPNRKNPSDTSVFGHSWSDRCRDPSTTGSWGLPFASGLCAAVLWRDAGAAHSWWRARVCSVASGALLFVKGVAVDRPLSHPAQVRPI